MAIEVAVAVAVAVATRAAGKLLTAARLFRTIRALIPAAIIAFAGAAGAQTWPTKPIRIIVPYDAGGVLDGLIRPLAMQLTEALGQSVVVENKGGANTAIGTGVCAKGDPDGYTFCASGNSVWLNQLLNKGLSYDPAKDLVPVTNMVMADGVIVANASMPFNTLKEMVAYAKANPGQLNFGSFGEGSVGHLYLEWIRDRTGTDITHVPYKGGGAVIQATVKNEVQLSFMATGAVYPLIKSGQLKPITAPAPQRSPFLPDVPTMYEEGFDFKPTSWFGLFAAAGTPRPIVDRMQAEVRKIIMAQKFREQVLTPQYYTPVASTPDDFAAFNKAERETAAQLVKISGLKPQG